MSDLESQMFAVLLKIHCLPPAIWNSLRGARDSGRTVKDTDLLNISKGTYPKTLSKFVRRPPNI